MTTETPNPNTAFAQRIADDLEAEDRPRPPKAEPFTDLQQKYVNQIVKSRIAREQAKLQDAIVKAEHERDQARLEVAFVRGECAVLRQQLAERK